MIVLKFLSCLHLNKGNIYSLFECHISNTYNIYMLRHNNNIYLISSLYRLMRHFRYITDLQNVHGIKHKKRGVTDLKNEHFRCITDLQNVHGLKHKKRSVTDLQNEHHIKHKTHSY